jgi:hypothetical protein
MISEEIELKLVHLIWRHGDRNPEITYPNDPYKDSSFWPDGLGQLTQVFINKFIYMHACLINYSNYFFKKLFQIGMAQHHELGNYLKNRYINSGFLQEHFDPKEVFIESSSINRTIQSALSNLKGFFGHNNDHLISSSLIPVNLVPLDTDNVSTMNF